MDLVLTGCFLLLFGEAIDGTLEEQRNRTSVASSGFIQNYAKDDQIALNNAINNGQLQKTKWGQLVEKK